MSPPPTRLSPPDGSLVDAIRSASRRMVRELGFMRSTLADTPYSPSAVHTLLEIGARGSMSAVEITQFLGLDKSSVSRMLRKLVEAGELEEAVSEDDARVKRLTLTPQGRRTRAGVDAYARRKVSRALSRLAPAEQEQVGNGLAAYAAALSDNARHALSQDTIEIARGYRPGVVGRVAEMHGRYYATHEGMGWFFESRVAAGLAEFTGRADRPRNGLWTAWRNGCAVGAIAIDGEDLGDDRAHLRWFIVDDSVRGLGVGRRLLDEAVSFCDAEGFVEIQLWTFSGLDAARHLYESCGFALAEEWLGTQWGREVREQRFSRSGVR
jgi:DNA-binding MarR family transcriptional regulator/N-acetylglutamate synthase-like GNAT family acetyltransferase